MRTLCTIWLTVACALVAQAQKQRVVLDWETGEPIGGVNIATSAPHPATTDSLGRFTIADSCRSAVFSHVNYESRLLQTAEMGDTVFLISKYLGVREVVVVGRAKEQELQVKKNLKLEKTEAQLAAANPASGFNLLPLLARLFKGRHHETKAQRNQRILDNY